MYQIIAIQILKQNLTGNFALKNNLSLYFLWNVQNVKVEFLNLVDIFLRKHDLCCTKYLNGHLSMQSNAHFVGYKKSPKT